MNENIRNFCIVAHIDHGKSTLADRFLEITGTVEKRKMKEQYLDQLELERERGITIKMAPVRMKYALQNNVDNAQIKNEFVLNLIDTPGHPDFSYEVSRALAAVEGAVLLVDGMQGIQAQTLSNFYFAKKAGLKIIGAINKVDLNIPNLDKLIEDLANLIETDPEKIHKISAKTGEGVEELLEDIIISVPSPSERKIEPSLKIERGARAMIFDSFYDDHKGIIVEIRTFDGAFSSGEEIIFSASGEKIKMKEVGYFSPGLFAADSVKEGEIGYVVTGIKEPRKIMIGDTIINSQFPISNFQLKQNALPGYKEPNPVVFVSFFPDNPDDFENLKKSLERLRLNDSAFVFEPDFNEVLGRGFKGGFLGQLHFEIVAQRLEREFGMKTVTSFPSVEFRIKTPKNKKELVSVRNPKDLPDEFDEIWEPMIKISIICPPEKLGGILQIKEKFRIEKFDTENIGANRLLLTARMPLAELISNFDDTLKSVSQGFASFSYQEDGYKKSDLVKLEILVAGESVPALSRILPKDRIDSESRSMVIKLKETLPRQQFSQAIQAKTTGRIVARETIPALKKDVAGYLYGGDRTRKMKLWKKQQKGKKKLLSMAKVRIMPEDFKKLLAKE